MSRINKRISAKVVNCVSASDILGTSKTANTPSVERHVCINCGKAIPQARIDALRLLGTPKNQWTHMTCSTTSKIKGIYMGEVGTSKLQLCDKIYNDSVRSMFKKSVEASDDEDDTENDENDR